MRFSFKQKTVNNVANLQNHLEKKATDDVMAFMELIKEFLEEKMQEPKTGRTYKLKDGSSYTASAPGEYPGVKYGELINSIQIKRNVGSNQHITRLEIGSDVPHGEILEKKAQEGKSGGRFWLTRAFEEHEDLLKNSLDKLGQEVDGDY